VSKHYHVIAGLRGGYLPNTNEVYTSRKDAVRGAQFHLEAYRDAGEKVLGSARSGFWIARESESLPGTFWDYVEVSDPCTDAEHLTEEWQEDW